MDGETLILIGDIFIGIGLGILLMSFVIYVVAKRFERRLQSGIDEVVNKVQVRTVGLVVEKHDNTIFCFAEEDKQFICQGKDLAEIRQAFQSRFPNKMAYLAGGDPVVVKLLEEQTAAEPKIETT
jgi:hypothetical protein